MNLFQHIFERGDDAEFEPRPAERPTTARPGTAEKIVVLAARVEAGEDLWHPNDVVIRCEPRAVEETLWRHWFSVQRRSTGRRR